MSDMYVICCTMYHSKNYFNNILVQTMFGLQEGRWLLEQYKRKGKIKDDTDVD